MPVHGKISHQGDAGDISTISARAVKMEAGEPENGSLIWGRVVSIARPIQKAVADSIKSHHRSGLPVVEMVPCARLGQLGVDIGRAQAGARDRGP